MPNLCNQQTNVSILNENSFAGQFEDGSSLPNHYLRSFTLDTWTDHIYERLLPSIAACSSIPAFFCQCSIFCVGRIIHLLLLLPIRVMSQANHFSSKDWITFMIEEKTSVKGPTKSAFFENRLECDLWALSCLTTRNSQTMESWIVTKMLTNLSFCCCVQIVVQYV